MVIGSLLLALAWWGLWRLTTDESRVREVVNSATGHFLEIGLYKDHPRSMLSALWALQGASLRLGGLLVLPSVLFLIPLLLVLPYLNACYAYRPLAVGESTVVSFRALLGPDWATLEVPEGLSVESGPIAYPAPRGFMKLHKDVEYQNLVWRLKAEAPGTYYFKVRVGKREIAKRVRVGPTSSPMKPSRTKSLKEWLQNPTESPLASGWEEVRVDYPARELWLGNYKVHWLLVFLVLFLIAVSLVGKLLPKRG